MNLLTSFSELAMDFHSSENGLSRIAHKTISMRFRKIGHKIRRTRNKSKTPLADKNKPGIASTSNRQKKRTIVSETFVAKNKAHSWVKIQIVANANCFTQQRSEQQQNTKKKMALRPE